MSQPSAQGEDKNTVVIGIICWSLRGASVGDKCRVSRYDAYEMKQRDEREQT